MGSLSKIAESRPEFFFSENMMALYYMAWVCRISGALRDVHQTVGDVQMNFKISGTGAID